MLLMWDFQFRLLSNSMPRYSTLSLHSSEEKRRVLLSISLVNLWSHVFLYHVNNVKKLSWVHFTKATLCFKQIIIFVEHVVWTMIHHFLKNATKDGQQWSRSAITRIRFIATFIDRDNFYFFQLGRKNFFLRKHICDIFHRAQNNVLCTGQNAHTG